ncbi:hypothetical protein BCR34DRAFT_244341 [Clohesyomyces aquaticus]|uniref:Secreted protein n=1 Tax=Clohesyomyces aquaticus TaxID=1231657 RepID=A0A1Y1ZVD2_9PLEO|nr:hypothetical protein BCR34DRAFT_244341 [Clohesyomyces aquaticus]
MQLAQAAASPWTVSLHHLLAASALVKCHTLAVDLIIRTRTSCLIQAQYIDSKGSVAAHFVLQLMLPSNCSVGCADRRPPPTVCSSRHWRSAEALGCLADSSPG